MRAGRFLVPVGGGRGQKKTSSGKGTEQGSRLKEKSACGKEEKKSTATTGGRPEFISGTTSSNRMAKERGRETRAGGMSPRKVNRKVRHIPKKGESIPNEGLPGKNLNPSFFFFRSEGKKLSRLEKKRLEADLEKEDLGEPALEWVYVARGKKTRKEILQSSGRKGSEGSYQGLL